MRGQSLKQLVEAEGPQAIENTLRDLANDKENPLKLGTDVTIQELFESFVGLENLQATHRQAGFVNVNLAEAAVRVSAFSNITGVLLGNEVIEGYNYASGIGDSLVRTYRTKYIDERIPGFTASEKPLEVKEGDAYDESGVMDKYITLGTGLKMGRIINVTEEAVLYDQTGMLVEKMRGIGELCALEREKTILKAVTGVTQCYFPSGSGANLYGGAPYIKTSNGLSDWTNIEACLVDCFAAMTDENGELVNSMPTAILVPTNLLFTAKRIIGATEILTKNPTTGTAGTTAQARETMSSNPVDNYRIISSPQVSNVQSSNPTTNWWLGDFQRQFRWKEVLPLQVFRRPENGDMQFERDIVTGFKVRYLGNVFAVDQRYVAKNTA
jgi:hypothetical protein